MRFLSEHFSTLGALELLFNSAFVLEVFAQTGLVSVFSATVVRAIEKSDQVAGYFILDQRIMLPYFSSFR